MVVATYNGEKFLLAQLESIAAQTRVPDELIISDDNSSDSTLQVVSSFARTAPFPVHVIRNRSRVGYTANFGRALERANGDLVFLCDQDDVWLTTKVERICSLAEGEPDIMVFMHDVQILDGVLSPSSVTKLANYRRFGTPYRAYVMGAAAAIRGPFLRLLLPIPTGIAGHDNYIVGVAIAIQRRRLVHESLMLYRRHGGNSSMISYNSTEAVRRSAAMLGRLRLAARRVRSVPDRDRCVHLSAVHRGVDSAATRAEGYMQVQLRDHAARVSTVAAQCEQRLRLMALPRWRRLLPVITMYRDGTYRHSHGLIGVARDLFLL